MQKLFCIPQRYDFSSKSQHDSFPVVIQLCCFVYRKGTIFQANHNTLIKSIAQTYVVLYTAKVRFFKQITTGLIYSNIKLSCFVYRKGTIFQANHNTTTILLNGSVVVLYTANVRFFKQITTNNIRTLQQC